MSIELLKAICACNDYMPDGFTKEPQRIGDWSVASDGHRLLAILEDYGLPVCAKTRGVDEWLKEEVTGVAVPMTTLREFVADIKMQKDCLKCSGTGKVNCDECGGKFRTECECPKCGDTHEGECNECNLGKQTCMDCDANRSGNFAAHGRISGCLVNRKLLALPFRSLPESLVYIHATAPEEMLRFYGNGWRLYVMPMRDYGGEKTIKEFEIPATEQTA